MAFLRPGPRRVSSFLSFAFVRIARTYRGKPRGSRARSRSGAGARRYRRGSFPSSTLDTSRTRHAGVAPGGRLGPSHASDRRRLRPRPRPSAPDPSGPERLRTGRRADGRVERLTRTVHAVGSSSREGRPHALKLSSPTTVRGATAWPLCGCSARQHRPPQPLRRQCVCTAPPMSPETEPKQEYRHSVMSHAMASHPTEKPHGTSAGRCSCIEAARSASQSSIASPLFLAGAAHLHGVAPRGTGGWSSGTWWS